MMNALCFGWIVEDLEIAVRHAVDKCRKTDQLLLALLDFQQFG